MQVNGKVTTNPFKLLLNGYTSSIPLPALIRHFRVASFNVPPSVTNSRLLDFTLEEVVANFEWDSSANTFAIHLGAKFGDTGSSPFNGVAVDVTIYRKGQRTEGFLGFTVTTGLVRFCVVWCGVVRCIELWCGVV